MSFYGGRGDFYRGVGDPGLFSFLGKAASTAFHFLAPAPIKAAVSAATGIITHARGKAIAARESAAARGLTTGLVGKHWGPGVGIMAPGGGITQRAIAQRGVAAMHRGAKGRPVVMTPSGVPTFGVGGRRRHMNVANVKALHRAVRRLLGFRHLVTKVERSLAKLARKHHAPFQRGRAETVRGPFRPRPLLKHGDPAGDFYMGDG
jgi:hypothetical protein